MLKSQSTAWESPFGSGRMITFAGLMSRWMIRAACRSRSAKSMSMPMLIASSIEIVWMLKSSESGAPSMNSRTRTSPWFGSGRKLMSLAT